MNNLIALLLFVIVPIGIFFVIIFWSACALGKRADRQTDDAFIKMIQDQSNITSGSAVIKK
jgi:hypothetical protein